MRFFTLLSLRGAKNPVIQMIYCGVVLCCLRAFSFRLLPHFSIPFLLLSVDRSTTSFSSPAAGDEASLPAFPISNAVFPDGSTARFAVVPGVLYKVWEWWCDSRRKLSSLRSTREVSSTIPPIASSSTNDDSLPRSGSASSSTPFCLSFLFMFLLRLQQSGSFLFSSTSSPLSLSPSASRLGRLFRILKGFPSWPALFFDFLCATLSSFDIFCVSVDDALMAFSLLCSVERAFPWVNSQYGISRIVLSLISSAVVQRMLVFLTQQLLEHEASTSSFLSSASMSSLLDGEIEHPGVSNREGGAGEAFTTKLLAKGLFFRMFTLRRWPVDYSIYALTHFLWDKKNSDGGRGVPSSSPERSVPSGGGSHDDNEQMPVSDRPIHSNSPSYSPSLEAPYSHVLLSLVNGRGYGFRDAILGFSAVVDPYCSWANHAQGILARLQYIMLYYAVASLVLGNQWDDSYETHLGKQVRGSLPILLSNVLRRGTSLGGTPSMAAAERHRSSVDTSTRAANDSPSRGGNESEVLLNAPAQDPSLLRISSSSLPPHAESHPPHRSSTALLVPVSIDYFLSSWNSLAFFVGGMLTGYAFLGSRFLLSELLRWASYNESISEIVEKLGLTQPLKIRRAFKESRLEDLRGRLFEKEEEIIRFLTHMEDNPHSHSSCFFHLRYPPWRIKKTIEVLSDVQVLIAMDLECCICPITLCLMEEPVTTADGHTYDSMAIREWLRHHKTSPLTNMLLENPNVTPNRKVKKMIRKVVDVLEFRV